jgi:hypothetical protein
MDRRNMKSTNVKSQSDRTVCLMEDDGPTLEVWQETVKECGGVAAVARNPDHVVALAEKGVRHFILDCHMGSADRSEEGLNALERLKDKYSDARVGILTGYNQYKPKAMRLKPDHFLVKSGNHQTDVRSMLTFLYGFRIGLHVGKARRIAADPAPAQSIPVASADPPPLDANHAAYLRMRRDSAWMRRSKGMYVCIVDGMQVRADKNKEALLAYVRARFAARPRFVTRVLEAEDREVVDIPSDMDCDDV